MTKEEVLRAIQKIRDEAKNDERAHIDEDDLRKRFIQFVAQRDDELGEIARLVLSTDGIYFGRWYA